MTHFSSKTTRFKPLRSFILTIGAVAGLTLQTDVMARPGYSSYVKSWCATAKRPAPVFAADECSTCHGSFPGSRTAMTAAFLSKNLDAFCPASAPNNAPTLTLSPSGIITASAGQAVQLTASATDPDKNPVELAAKGLPTGADFNAATGVFSWTPETSGVYTFVIQATDQPNDLTQAKTVQQTVTVQVTEADAVNTPPKLDPITTPQSASTQSALRFNVTAVDAEGDELVLAATNLPKGATFNFKGMVNGKWTGEFLWQATADQVGKRFTTQFSVREAATAPILQDSQDVEFQVMAPTTDTAIKQVMIDQANYRKGNLTVTGRVKLKSGSTIPSGLSVTVTDANGITYGQAKLTSKGTWTLTVPVATDSVPCRIQATVNGVTSVSQPVQPIKPLCRKTTVVENQFFQPEGENEIHDQEDDGQGHGREENALHHPHTPV